MIVDALALGLLSVTAATLPAPDDDFWYSDWGPLLLQSKVTPDTALQTTAVNACIGKRARTLASLPFHVYEWGGPAWTGSKRQARYRVPGHPLERILGRQPNDWQTGVEFIEMMEGHVCSRGNAYAVVVPGRAGAVDQLIPKHPDRMQVVRLENGRLGYLYRKPDGQLQRYTQDEILHLRGQTLDGVVGVSPIALHRHAVELAQQAEDHGVKYYRAGKASGILKFPQGSYLEDEEARDKLRRSWRNSQTGDDLFSVAVLEDGLEWQAMGFNQKDAQYLESRRFQVVEICRMFDVPPIMIYSEDQQDNTYANVEQKDLWFIKHCAQPWIRRWEQCIWRDLIVDQDRYYAKFPVEGLLRGDTKTRGEWYERMMGLSVYCPNDVLELEDRNPHPDGERYYISVQLMPVEQAGQTAGEGTRIAQQATSALELSESIVVAEGGEPTVETVESDAVGQVLDCPVEMSPGDSTESVVSQVWAEDIAARLANSELRDLSDRLDKANEDRGRFNAWVASHWGNKRREYVMRTVEPYLQATGRSTLDEVVDRIVGGAISALTNGDPAEVYEIWKTERAAELAQILCDGGDRNA